MVVEVRIANMYFTSVEHGIFYRSEFIFMYNSLI